MLYTEGAERLHSCCVPAKLEYHVDIEDLNQKKRTGFFTSETISYRFSKITVTPNPRIFKMMTIHMKDILMELRRLSQGENPSQELLEDIALITQMLNDMKEERK